jgi:uncharacterized protein with HEPN domain
MTKIYHPQRLNDYVGDIIQAIERIFSYVEDADAAAFAASNIVQDAVLHNLEVIGEAGHQIEKHFPEFAEAHPELPLKNSYQMRNIVVHGYFMVDMATIWDTIEKDLPGYYDDIKRIQSRLDEPALSEKPHSGASQPQ